MAKTSVTTEITTEQEIRLLDRYGRGCSRETLVDRAVAEAVALQGKGTPWLKHEPKKRKAKEQPQPSLLDGSNGADAASTGK